MRRYLLPLCVLIALVVATIADEGKDGISGLLVWPLFWANCLLVGCLLGWLLARLTSNWEPPTYLRWLDVFTPPTNRD